MAMVASTALSVAYAVAAMASSAAAAVSAIALLAAAAVAAMALPAEAAVAAMALPVAATFHICGVCNVNLDCGIASGIHTANGGCANDARTGSNAAIDINVSAPIVTFVDGGLHGGAGFALL
jgi:hypothetical protein